ncbi:hypothetical protein MRS44_008064 [Fusarium solani]|uniref:uncharacterized protein n=1 Tax=Fusarium solani TaxID=169388 RepID=UPI0032C4B210|nr:hypothetical protein MRS44_008064 [Fusarium solani]
MSKAELESPLDLSSLAGRGVLITGGASGLGAAMAKAFAKAGSYVTIADLQQELGEKYAVELTAEGYNVQFVHTDVTSWASQVKAFESASLFCPTSTIDIVIPSAAVFSETFLDLATPVASEQLSEPSTTVFDVNITGTYYTAKLAAHYFRPTSGSEHESSRLKSLIFMASLGGYIAGARFTAYGATKFAVRGIWKHSRDDLKALGIRSNLIAPWFIPTPMTESQVEHLKGKIQFAKVDDVVDAALRCAVDQRIQGRAIAVTPGRNVDLRDDPEGLDAGVEVGQVVSGLDKLIDAVSTMET